MAAAALALAAAPLVALGPSPGPSHGAVADGPAPRPLRRRLAAFIVLFVLYVGVETGIGGWAPTHLTATGRSVAEAARWTAGFWTAFTAGRLLGAGVSTRMRSDRLVAGGLVGAVACLLLAAVLPAGAGYAYVLAGLALAPVFPTGVAWLASALPGVRGSTATVLGGALLGGVTVPPLIGQAISMTGAGAVPWLLAACAAGAAALALAMASRGATRDGR